MEAEALVLQLREGTGSGEHAARAEAHVEAMAIEMKALRQVRATLKARFRTLQAPFRFSSPPPIPLPLPLLQPHSFHPLPTALLDVSRGTPSVSAHLASVYGAASARLRRHLHLFTAAPASVFGG
jgi:hypothetical protein